MRTTKRLSKQNIQEPSPMLTETKALQSNKIRVRHMKSWVLRKQPPRAPYRDITFSSRLASSTISLSQGRMPPGYTVRSSPEKKIPAFVQGSPPLTSSRSSIPFDSIFDITRFHFPSIIFLFGKEVPTVPCT